MIIKEYKCNKCGEPSKYGKWEWYKWFCQTCLKTANISRRNNLGDRKNAKITGKELIIENWWE